MSSTAAILAANRQHRMKQIKRKAASDQASNLSNVISTVQIPEDALKTLTTTPSPPATAPNPPNPQAEAMVRFEEEKNWAIHQLELGLKYRRPTKEQANESQRIINTLKNPKVSFPKKRHLLHVTFGGKLREYMAKDKKG
ncbi:hypothetical protein P9112_005983 [Eukaryota sp. TZLM1-RC]